MCWEGVLLNKCGCIITETESLSYRTAAVRPPDCALSLTGNYFWLIPRTSTFKKIK